MEIGQMVKQFVKNISKPCVEIYRFVKNREITRFDLKKSASQPLTYER